MPPDLTPPASASGGRPLFELLGEAIAHHQAGRAQEAARLYRAVLAASPDEPDAHHNLAILLVQGGAPWRESLPHFRAAWAVDPAHGQHAASYLQALVRAGERAEAERVHAESKRRGVALPPLDRGGASASSATSGGDFKALGVTAWREGRGEAAAAAFSRAASQAPHDAEIPWLHAQVLAYAGRFDEADVLAKGAVTLRPEWAEGRLLAGQVAMRRVRLTEALESLREAVRLAPGSFQAHHDLATVALWRGEVSDALAEYDRAVALQPTNLAARSTRHFASHYLPQEEPAALLETAREFGTRAAAAATPFRTWRCDATADRLRVGFVSSDLGDHPVGYFLESVLDALHGRDVECFAYPAQVLQDPVAARLRRRFAKWSPLAGLADAEAARRIHEDAPHVLLDLAGHTANNRLPVFAWRPAPLQVSWLGYFATTGLAEMDALLTDAASMEAGDEAHFTEALWCLPETRLCFTAPEDAPAVAPLPALARGHLTFGSFQNLAKVNGRVLAAWAQVLDAVPRSRLLLHHGALGDEGTRDALRRRMGEAGLDVRRVDFGPGMPRLEYLGAHADVDVILDTFPYPGGTTTCEASWMGVPTVTLRGASLLSRQGAALLRGAGLDDWVASDTASYVARAVAASSDLDALAALRATLRERMRASPLMDAARFTNHFEAALRASWRRVGTARLSAAS